jgi:hypothetical protein
MGFCGPQSSSSSTLRIRILQNKEVKDGGDFAAAAITTSLTFISRILKFTVSRSACSTLRFLSNLPGIFLDVRVLSKRHHR